MEIVKEEEGTVEVRSAPGSVRALSGCLHDAQKPPPSLEELEEHLIESLAEEDERIR